MGGMLYDLLNPEVRVGVKTYDPESEKMYQQLLAENSPRGQAARIAGLMADRRPYYGRIQVESGKPAQEFLRRSNLDNAGAYFPSSHYIAMNYPHPLYDALALQPLDIMGHEFGHAIGTTLGGNLERHGRLPEYFERQSFQQPIPGPPQQEQTTKTDLSKMIRELLKKQR